MPMAVFVRTPSLMFVGESTQDVVPHGSSASPKKGLMIVPNKPVLGPSHISRAWPDGGVPEQYSVRDYPATRTA